jgi:uncharacterized protein with ATP-grasp and redox domains
MTMTSIRKLPLDEDSVKKLYTKILEIPALRGLDWNITSPEVIEDAWKKIVKRVNDPDPFCTEKSNQNKNVMALYPFLQKMVNEEPDPLYPAIKLAILGNSLDFMVADPSFTIENSIKDRINTPLSEENYSKFKNRLETSKHLVYFGDNSGEIVADKLLIETMKTLYKLEIVFVVRSVATLNDATLEEAEAVGMDKVVKVIENGIDGPLPGTVLKRCSDEVKKLVQQADMIISKGGGNFDTLDEERNQLNNKVSYLLLSKCDPQYKTFGVKLYHTILANW